MVKIALLIMVKNEEKRILTTLASVVHHVDGIVMLDTGSTDETVSISRQFALDHGIVFHLKKKAFQDFSTSRNVMFAFVKKLDYTHLLLLDSNDELKCNQPLCTEKCNHDLKSFIEQHPNICTFLIKQQWYTGKETIDFYNIRLVENNLKIAYRGSVHEYLDVGSLSFLKSDDFFIFQNRVLDNDGKTLSRWEKDLKLLLKDVKKKPTCSRTCFYLAQTYECLNNVELAFIWYKKRTTMDGFLEEKFTATLKCGKYETDTTTKIVWYLKAMEIFQDRVEPFLEIARLYRFQYRFLLAYNFATMACHLDVTHKYMLFTSEKVVVHDRWQELSISSFYVGKYTQGYNACLKAIASGYDTDLNTKNLEFYKEKLNM